MDPDIHTDMIDETEITEVVNEPIIKETQTNKIPALQQLTLLGALMFLLFSGAITPKVLSLFNSQDDITTAQVDAIEIQEITTPAEIQQAKPEIKPFSEVTLIGETAYVWDVQKQRALYKKEATKQVPLASVTKLMTALLAHELLSEESTVTISKKAIRQDGNSGLLQDEIFNRQILSDLVLMSSSNDGAYAIATAAGKVLQTDNAPNAFVHAMNIRAEELQLYDTYYRNPTGLDISPEEGGAYGSAKDMAFLMEYIVINQPDLLASTQRNNSIIESNNGISHQTENTNYYINEIPGLIASKTGYTDLAGGNLVVAFDAGLNRPIVIAVLGSTRHERFTDVITLIKETQRYIAQQ